jgi:senataxin
MSVQVQYRMHAQISKFVSTTFYDGKIRNGKNVEKDTLTRYHQSPGLGPLAFYHVDGLQSIPEGSASLVNTAEADMVIALVQCLILQVRTRPVVVWLMPSASACRRFLAASLSAELCYA